MVAPVITGKYRRYIACTQTLNASSRQNLQPAVSCSRPTCPSQIVQMLRSRGSMDFDEISLVIPCLEMALDYGYEDLNAPQGWEPRAYKTHFWHDHCPQGEGVKYIYVIRDPR